LVAMLSAAVEVVNAILLLVLLYVYAQNYFKVKSKFTASLLFFAFFLLLERIVVIYFYIAMDMCYATQLAEQVRPILSVIETVGLIALLRVTWK